MDEIAKDANGGDAQEFFSLLSSPTRDFLVRNDGEQVKIDSLKGKTIGVLFSGIWCGPCSDFTPQLVEVYNELSREDFEIIFVSDDRDEECFKYNFGEMPWLAVPFTDSETRDRISKMFEIIGIPILVIIDAHGKGITYNGVGLIQRYGAEAYPFTEERMEEISKEDERGRREQTLKYLLVSPSRDFVLSQNGNKVPVSELEGKTIGLLFTPSYLSCQEYHQKLVEVYNKLKENGEDFEIVTTSFENDPYFFEQEVHTKPWLGLPFNDLRTVKLTRHFMLSIRIPELIILGPDGKTRHSNVVYAINHYGVLAYPFTPEKFEELKEIEKSKEEIETQTLESLLVSGDRNYLLGKDWARVLVSDLVGKTILLYFSSRWNSPCRDFTPLLVEVYEQLKEWGVEFELIFISIDHDEDCFLFYYSQMPWLALPFRDPRISPLKQKIIVDGIPTLVALGPTGKTVTKEAIHLVETYGAYAYPFTEERWKEIESQCLEMTKEWPEKVNHHPLHEEHELKLTRVQIYICGKCGEEGQIWSYQCDKCHFDLHAECALKEDADASLLLIDPSPTQGGDEDVKDGLVCDGNVCTKA